MRLGQVQSKSAMGLKAPMRALVRRRSRERRLRSRSSMSMTRSTQGSVSRAWVLGGESVECDVAQALTD